MTYFGEMPKSELIQCGKILYFVLFVKSFVFVKHKIKIQATKTVKKMGIGNNFCMEKSNTGKAYKE